MAKFKMGVTVPAGSVATARLGTTGAPLVDNDRLKFVKLAADSQFNLCAVGDAIEGQMLARESATQDGFAIGSVLSNGKIAAVCDGLEATPGVGAVAVGDFVRCGTPVAGGTALTTGPAVVTATNQPGATMASLAVAADVIDLATRGPWRVVSLGAAGAVGDTCVIERVSA